MTGDPMYARCARCGEAKDDGDRCNNPWHNKPAVSTKPEPYTITELDFEEANIEGLLDYLNDSLPESASSIRRLLAAARAGLEPTMPHGNEYPLSNPERFVDLVDRIEHHDHSARQELWRWIAALALRVEVLEGVRTRSGRQDKADG